MLPLRWSLRWRLASAALLIAVLLLGISRAVWLSPINRVMFDWFPHFDKFEHLVTYAFLAVWFSGQYRRSAYWRIALGLFLYGILIEACQHFVGYRTADVYDVVANVSGIVAGLFVALLGAGGWSARLERRFAGPANEYE